MQYVWYYKDNMEQDINNEVTKQPEGNLGELGGVKDTTKLDETTNKQVIINSRGDEVVYENGRIVSGTPNPNGRPKGKRNFATLFKEAIEVIAESKGTTAGQVESDLIKRGIMEAIKGDFYFWNSIIDRLHGKPATKISFDDEVEGLEVKIIRNKTDDIKDTSNGSI